jgi:decaprenyl-phosphate phosphoribosyltransferase
MVATERRDHEMSKHADELPRQHTVSLTVQSRRQAASSMLRALRPKQWVKNVLVAAAPLASGDLFSWLTLPRIVLAFVAFCLASSAGYLVNDVLDVASDRLHPTKRTRPIAAGEVSVRTAIIAAVVLAVLSLAVSLLVNPVLLLVVAIYLVVTASYSLGLKNQPVFDLAIVTSGFLLRAVAGGAAAHVPLSQWFLLVTSFGSLFMVAGKRYADVTRVSDAATVAPSANLSDRDGNPMYSASYLRFVFSVAAASAIVFYALWSVVVGQNGEVWAQVSVAPFVLAILRYAVDVDQGRAGAPEDVVFRDRGLQLVGLVWLVTFVIAAHGG